MTAIKKTSFKQRINNIITDLLNEGTYTDFISLQENKTCNAHTIFLEQELQHRFKKIELKEFAQKIYISPNKFKPCSDEECGEIKEKKYGLENKLKSKSQLCRGISIYYVRVFNLLGAIMVALDSENNMCHKRINALYKSVDENSSFKNGVCENDLHLYPKSIMDLSGIKELLSLYQMYNIDGFEVQNQKILEQMKELQKKLGTNIENTSENNVSPLNNNLEEEDDDDEDDDDDNINRNTSKENTKKLKKTLERLNNNLNKKTMKFSRNNENKFSRNNLRSLTKKVKGVKINLSKNDPRPIVAEKKDLQKLPIQQTSPPINNPNAPPITTQSSVLSPKLNPNMNQKGGRKKKKNQRGGANFFSGIGTLLGIVQKPKENIMESANDETFIEGEPILETVVRENQKTMDDFKAVIESTRKNAPKDMIKDGTITKLKGTLPNLSKREECSNSKLNLKDYKVKKNNNNSFNEYLGNYNLITTHNKESKEKLNVILNNLIEKSSISGKFKLKDLSSEILFDLETKTRDMLVIYYSKCEELFKSGFYSLVSGIEEAQIIEQLTEVEKRTIKRKMGK